MFGWLKSKLEAVGGVGKDLPFEVGEALVADVGPLWALHSGKKKADGSALSVFRCDITKKTAVEQQAARDALKRLRTIRHPCVVSHVADAEVDGCLLVATELVIPLSVQLNEGPLHPGAAFWGLQQIARALEFLNGSNLIHGNISPRSIMVDKAGDWKLFGFELTGNVSEFELHVSPRASLVDSAFAAPEVTRLDLSAIRTSAAHAVDAYAYGKLISTVLGPAIPSDVFVAQQALLRAPSQRPTPAAVVARGVFENAYTRALAAADELLVSDARAELLARIEAEIPHLPPAACGIKFLPRLAAASETGTGAERAHTVRLLVQLAARLTPEMWTETAAAHILKLFDCNDRGVRMALLQGLPVYAANLSQAMADGILARAANGFNDAAPELRELSVVSLAQLAPRLSTRVLENALGFLGNLLNDVEAGIRTNATVCLAKIAPFLSAATRARVLLPGFGARLRDPFAPARVAAVRGLLSTLRYHSAADIARRLIPGVAPYLVDPEEGVRAACADCVRQAVAAVAAAIEASRQDSGEIDISSTPEGPQQSGAAGKILSWAVTSVASVGGALVKKALQHGQAGTAGAQGSGAAAAAAGASGGTVSAAPALVPTPAPAPAPAAAPAAGTAAPDAAAKPASAAASGGGGAGMRLGGGAARKPAGRASPVAAPSPPAADAAGSDWDLGAGHASASSGWEDAGWSAPGGAAAAPPADGDWSAAGWGDADWGGGASAPAATPSPPVAAAGTRPVPLASVRTAGTAPAAVLAGGTSALDAVFAVPAPATAPSAVAAAPPPVVPPSAPAPGPAPAAPASAAGTKPLAFRARLNAPPAAATGVTPVDGSGGAGDGSDHKPRRLGLGAVRKVA